MARAGLSRLASLARASLLVVLSFGCAGGGDDPTSVSIDGGRDDAGTTVDRDSGVHVLAIETEALPAAELHRPYRATITARGGVGEVYRWAISDSVLPVGLRLEPSGTPTAMIVGTPTESGATPFVVTVEDSESGRAAATLTIEVAPQALTFVTTELPDGATTRHYEASVAARGGTGRYAWRVTGGSLPTGIGLRTNTPTITLAGLPAAAGTYDFMLEVEDQAGATTGRAFELSIVDDAVGGAPIQNWIRDILTTRLDIDASTGHATAEIVVGPSASEGVSFEVRDLTILEARTTEGRLAFRNAGGQLDVGVLAATETTTVTIAYRIDRGPLRGRTVFFPTGCGSGFPCRSSPADTSRYEVEIRAVPPGMTALFPERLGFDAIAFQVSWIVGELAFVAIGTTPGGLDVGLYHVPTAGREARLGSRNLLAATEWMEQTFGAYPWGDTYASVVGDARGFSGLETHPYATINPIFAGDQDIHIHEMVHGWFGTGVRFECWEDAVFSEGTATYLTARAIEVVDGIASANETWRAYGQQLGRRGNAVAWPIDLGNSCNAVMNPNSVYTALTYFRGAYFYRAVEMRIGRQNIDTVLRNIFVRHLGEAIRFQAVLDEIRAVSNWDPTACARKWLMEPDEPADHSCS